MPIDDYVSMTEIAWLLHYFFFFFNELQQSSGLLNYDFEYISRNTSHFFSSGTRQQAYPDKAYS